MRRGGLAATRCPPRGVRRIAWLRCEVREWMSLRLCYARRDAHFFNTLFSSFGVLSARCAGAFCEALRRLPPGRRRNTRAVALRAQAAQQGENPGVARDRHDEGAGRLVDLRRADGPG